MDVPEICHLRYEDWEPYTEPYPEGCDEETKAYLSDIRRKSAEHRIRKVNELYDSLKEAWPEGTAIDFYIALGKGNRTDDQIVELLADPEFIRQVVKESERLGIRKPAAETEDDNSEEIATEGDKEEEFDSETDSDDDDDDNDGTTRSRRTARRWTEAETAQFKQVVKDVAEANGTWKDIVRHFPGRTKEQCQTLYHRLRSTKELNINFRPRKGANAAGSRGASQRAKDERDRTKSMQNKLRHIHGLHFIYKKMDSWVGPMSEKLRCIANSNPVVNYIDQITAQKIVYPAVSPDGYLLDYRTWMKVLSQDPKNPFTRAHMNKRQLEYLTCENINIYLDKIVNLEESRPPNPEDDLLRNYWEQKEFERSGVTEFEADA